MKLPRNILSSDWSLGLSICNIASSFLGSTQTPLESFMVLRNSTDNLENLHISSFKVKSTFAAQEKLFVGAHHAL